jgi:hypothetical protein
MGNSALFDRYSADLERLIKRGEALENAMFCEYLPGRIEGKITGDARKALPTPILDYQSWYSEALACVEKLLPARVADFRAHYEAPKNRKELDVSTYRIIDALNGLSKAGNALGEYKLSQSAAIPHMQQQNAIVRGLKSRLSSSLYDIRTLIQADLFDEELDVARELLKKGFCRAAGAIAGVVFEGHLKQVCADHRLAIPVRSTISVANDKLKSVDVIDQSQWRFNQHLGDLRNLCDHKDSSGGSQEPKREQIEDLIAGVAKVIKTIV